jgi:hypothetical protein
MTVMTIRELDGLERTLSLKDRALPLRDASGLPLTGAHEIAESRALGSPFTVQQTTGAIERDTTISGEWNDFFLGDNTVWVSAAAEETIDGASVVVIDESPVRSVRDLTEIVDDMRRRGSLLRFSWLHIVRIGRISEFRQTWRTENDMEWAIDFKWVGIEETQEEAVPAVADPADDARALDLASQAVADAVAYPVTADEMSTDFVQRVDNRLASAMAAIFEIEDAVLARVDGISTSTQVFQRILSSMNILRDEAGLLALEIDGYVAAATLAVPDPEDLTSLGPGPVLAMLTANRTSARMARAMRQEAVRRRHDNLRTTEGVADIYIAREGDDLYSIAAAAGADWEQVRDYNQFSSTSLAPGQIVLVPFRGGRAA